MGHKRSVLRPRCIRPGRDWSQIPFYSILFYSILFYSILFYSIPFYSVLFYSILFCSILFYSILFYSILFWSILFLIYSILFYSVLFCSVLSKDLIASLFSIRHVLMSFTNIGMKYLLRKFHDRKLKRFQGQKRDNVTCFSIITALTNYTCDRFMHGKFGKQPNSGGERTSRSALHNRECLPTGAEGLLWSRLSFLSSGHAQIIVPSLTSILHFILRCGLEGEWDIMLATVTQNLITIHQPIRRRTR